ncbi:MAG TPA: hypothetical protein VFL74_03430 [Sphingomicrobium sp.]|nr:hypothetical protein [Sphingomicrobium sp.]
MTRKQIMTAAAVFLGAALALLAMTPLFVPMSQVTAGVIIGLVGLLCVLGVGFGIWDARRIEVKRKAKEHIWMKH